jgi:hypothetical protein
MLAVVPAWAQGPAPATPPPAWASPQPWFVYTVIIVVLAGSLLAILLIRASLGHSTWSLADALSEEAEVTATVVDAAGQIQPRLDAAGKPIMITEMRASVSRLVALMGMMAILLMFIGFGAFALYSFAMNGAMPASIDKVIYFLLGGMTLFAPYIVNQFRAIFESLSPKP